MPHQKSAKIHKQLPKNMPSWGKVRIAGGGDRIRTAAGWNRLDRERNKSYVRVRLPIDQITSVYLKNFIVRGGSSGCHQQCCAWNLLWTTGPNSWIRHSGPTILGPPISRKNCASCHYYSMCYLGKGCDKDINYLFTNHDSDHNWSSHHFICNWAGLDKE